MLGAAVSVFATIHSCGWSLLFPTTVEGLVWRVNCAIMGTSLGVYGLSEVVGFWQARYTEASMDLFGGYKKRTPWCYVFLFLGAVYFASRLCLIVESVISLRDMPEAAYQQVPWLQFLPRLM